MTRINVGIDPVELPNKLLLAEHREITRIPNAVSSGRAIIKDIPKNFTLGKGHVKFFYDKILYLKKRYDDIYNECETRGFNVTPKHSAFGYIRDELWNDYIPSEVDREIVLERINSKGFKLRTNYDQKTGNF